MRRCVAKDCQLNSRRGEPYCGDHSYAAQRRQECVSPGCANPSLRGEIHCADCRAAGAAPIRWRRPKPKSPAPRRRRPYVPMPKVAGCAEEGCAELVTKAGNRCKPHAAAERWRRERVELPEQRRAIGEVADSPV